MAVSRAMFFFPSITVFLANKDAVDGSVYTDVDWYGCRHHDLHA